jgi:hypothetical protein
LVTLRQATPHHNPPLEYVAIRFICVLEEKLWMSSPDQDDSSFKGGESPEDFIKEEHGTISITRTNHAKKRKSLDLSDETTSSIPNDPEGKAKLRARREANRIHAFKSRQRNKLLLQELQQTVAKLNQEKAGLERRNEVLTAQVEVLQKQNLVLLNNQQPALAFAALQQHNAALQQQIMGASSSSGATAPTLPDLPTPTPSGTATVEPPQQQQQLLAPAQPQAEPQPQQEDAAPETSGDNAKSPSVGTLMMDPLQMLAPTDVASAQQQQQPWLNTVIQQQLQANPLFLALFLQHQQQQQQLPSTTPPVNLVSSVAPSVAPSAAPSPTDGEDQVAV